MNFAYVSAQLLTFDAKKCMLHSQSDRFYDVNFLEYSFDRGVYFFFIPDYGSAPSLFF